MSTTIKVGERRQPEMEKSRKVGSSRKSLHNDKHLRVSGQRSVTGKGLLDMNFSEKQGNKVS